MVLGVQMTPPVFTPSRVEWMRMPEWRGRGSDDLWDLLLRGPPPYTFTCWPSWTVTLLEFPEVLAKAPCLSYHLVWRSSHPPLLFGKCRFLLDVFLRRRTDAVSHLKIWVWSFLALSNHIQARRYARSAFSVYKVKEKQAQLIERHPLRAWCWSSVCKRQLKYFFCNR